MIRYDLYIVQTNEGFKKYCHWFFTGWKCQYNKDWIAVYKIRYKHGNM